MHLEAGRPGELDEVVAWGKGHRERESQGQFEESLRSKTGRTWLLMKCGAGWLKVAQRDESRAWVKQR